MKKNNLIVMGNFIVGTAGLFLSFALLTIFLPRLLTVYQEFEAPIPPLIPLSPLLLVIPSLANFIIGLLVIFAGANKNKYLRWALLTLVVTVALAVLFIPLILSFTVLLPMFNLVNVIE